MRLTRWFGVVLIAGMMAHAQVVGTDARARQLIRELKLTVLPKESGYLGIIGEIGRAHV